LRLKKTKDKSKQKKEVDIMRTIMLFFLLIITGLCARLYSQDDITKYFVGIELNGVLCGYSDVTVNKNAEKNITELKQHTYASFSAMGRDISQKQEFNYRIDPESGNFKYHDSYMEQGPSVHSASMMLEDDTINILETFGDEANKVFIPENTILPNTMFFPHLAEDFGTGNTESKTYRIFNVRNGKVQDFEYTRLGYEELVLDNKKYKAVIVSESDPDTGMKTTYWIDRDSGIRLQMESQTNIRMYITDFSVAGRVKKGSWDDIIFIKTDEYIKDIRGIGSMTLNARMRVIPGPSLDDLNVDGQIFKGEIDGDMINGIFKIYHKKYSGLNSPSIAYYRDVSDDIALYLSPGEMIESDDQGIIELANDITGDAKNSWEAVQKLARWVIVNIDGSVLGGGAVETLDKREGACGSQSMLMAALCRAAGIPARVVWGCMYCHVDGGSFGHHGWNEVYMGDDGWIPIDVTSHEADYVDSGHVRLGELKTLVTVINFEKMKIQDYSVR